MDANSRGRTDKWVSARALAQQAHAREGAARAGAGPVTPPRPRSGAHAASGPHASHAASNTGNHRGGNGHSKVDGARLQHGNSTSVTNRHHPVVGGPSLSPPPSASQHQPAASDGDVNRGGFGSGSRASAGPHHGTSAGQLGGGGRRQGAAHAAEPGEVAPPQPRSVQMGMAAAAAVAATAGAPPSAVSSAANTHTSTTANWSGAHPGYNIPTPRHGALLSPERTSSAAPSGATAAGGGTARWAHLCGLPPPASSVAATNASAVTAAGASSSAVPGAPSGSLVGSFSASGSSPFVRPAPHPFSTSPASTARQTPAAGTVATSPFMEGLALSGAGGDGGGGSFGNGRDVFALQGRPFTGVAGPPFAVLPPSQQQWLPGAGHCSPPQSAATAPQTVGGQLPPPPPPDLAMLMQQMLVAAGGTGEAAHPVSMAADGSSLSAFAQGILSGSQQQQQQLSKDVMALAPLSLESNRSAVGSEDSDDSQASIRALVDLLNVVNSRNGSPRPDNTNGQHMGLAGDNIFRTASQPAQAMEKGSFPIFPLRGGEGGVSDCSGGVPLPHSQQQQQQQVAVDHFKIFSRTFGTGLAGALPSGGLRSELLAGPIAADLFSQLAGDGQGGGGGDGDGLMGARGQSAVEHSTLAPHLRASGTAGDVAVRDFSGTQTGPTHASMPSPLDGVSRGWGRHDAAVRSTIATAASLNPSFLSLAQPQSDNLRDLFSKLTQPAASPPPSPPALSDTAGTHAASRVQHEDRAVDSQAWPSLAHPNEPQPRQGQHTGPTGSTDPTPTPSRPAPMAHAILGGSGRGNSSASASGVWRQGASHGASAANSPAAGGAAAAPVTPLRELSTSLNTPTLSAGGSTSRRGGGEESGAVIAAAASATLHSPLSGGSHPAWVTGRASQVNSPAGSPAAGRAGASSTRAHRASLDAPTVTRASLACVFRETPPSIRHREAALANRTGLSSLSNCPSWPPRTESEVEKLLKSRNANKLLRHLTIVGYSRQNVKGVQELFDAWARNGIPAPDMGFGAYYYYVKEKSDKLLCMKHNGRGATPGHGYGKCDFESRRPNSTCRYEHVCLFCRSKEHGWFEEGKCEGYQQLLAEAEQLGVVEEDVEVMLNAMEKTSAWAH